MPKAKTHKATAKRVKITKKGKMMKKHVNTGHMKQKQSQRTKRRKGGMEEVSSHRISQVKRLLPGN